MRTPHHTGRARPTAIARMLLLIALLLAVPMAPAARGQDGSTAVPKTDDAGEITADEISARIEALTQIEEPDADQTAALESLNAAKGFLDARDKAKAKQAEIDQFAQSGPDRLAELATEQTEIDATLAADLDLEIEAPPSSATAEELATLLEPLKARLASAKTDLEAAQKQRDDTAQDIKERKARREKLPDDIAQASQRLEDVKTALASQPAASDATIATRAQRDALSAERSALEARIARLQAEVRTFDTLQSLIQAREKRDDGRVAIAKRRVDALQEEVDRRTTAIAERTREEARQAQLAAANAHSVVQKLLEDNARLTEEVAEVAARNKSANDRLQEIDLVYRELSDSFESFKALVEQVGLTDVVGFRLRNQLADLPPVSVIERRLRLEREEMHEAQSRRFDLDAMSFGDPAEDAAKLLEESLDPVPAGRREAVTAAAAAALENQAKYVDQLKSAYDTYYSDINATLLRLHREEQALVTLVTQYRSFIQERILWTQSADALAPSDLMEAVKAIGWLGDPRSWAGLAIMARDDFTDHALLTVVVLLPFPVLMLLRGRMRRRLAETGELTRRISTDRVGHTLLATILTVLLALPWPYLLHIVAWRIGAAGDGARFAEAISGGLERISFVIFWFSLILVLCRKGGLADAHFRWPPQNLGLVRLHVRWLLPVAVPISFLLGALGGESLESYANSLGRIAFIIGMVILAVFFQRVMHPAHGLMTPILARHHGGWLERLRHVWTGVLVGLPIVLAVGAAIGFAYTALHLSQALLRTGYLAVVTLAIHALLMRWLFVTRRRLALDQALRKREAAAKAAREAREAAEGEEGEPEPAPEFEPVVADDEIDVAAVSAQAGQLVRGVVLVAVVFGMLLIWSDVLPAFRFLQNVEIWSSGTAPVTAAVESAPSAVSGVLPAGGVAPPPAATPSGITVANLVSCIVILLLTLIVSRNIPGVLEITLLQRLPLTAGARYATSTLVRYTLVIVGVVLAFDAIGIGWAKVQFLAAAVTVGLGFGLQEIFANFVSGLILLFERPIRIGDTVTVGAVSGTVTRIQMRATTITDWDRKEMIIPNKEFVTGQIMNWSLSESIIRARIPVGVAYGSDTELAKKLLLEVAQAHPRVLDQPEPRALFMGFGDSTLDLELRAFISDLEYNLITKDALLGAIDAVFKEHGIEIAFPQRDLHVRSIEAALPVSRSEDRDGETPQDPAD